MLAPLSHFRLITPLLILLSAGVMAALVAVGGYDVVPLGLIWAAAGLLSAGIWNIVSRFSLDGGANVKAFAISWPLLSLSTDFAYCYLPHTDLFYRSLAEQFAMLAILTLEMSLWQHRHAILKHLLIGLILGLVSTLLPHALTWLLMLPVACYFMRCWSARNILSALTGVVLGIWFVYCGVFLVCGMATADGVVGQYAQLLQRPDLGALAATLGVWQYTFLGLMALLLVMYSISATVLSPGSVRVGASIKLVSVLSFLLVLLMLADLSHLTDYLCLFAFFLSLQLTIHQANIHSAVYEWWTLLILLIIMALCILPSVPLSIPFLN